MKRGAFTEAGVIRHCDAAWTEGSSAADGLAADADAPDPLRQQPLLGAAGGGMSLKCSSPGNALSATRAQRWGATRDCASPAQTQTGRRLSVWSAGDVWIMTRVRSSSDSQLEALRLINRLFEAHNDWPSMENLRANARRTPYVDLTAACSDLRDAGLINEVAGAIDGSDWPDAATVGISARGLKYVGNDRGDFVSAVSYIGRRSARFRPARPTLAEARLTVTNEEIRLALRGRGVPHPDMRTEWHDDALLRLAVLVRDLGARFCVGLTGPDSFGAWSVDINPHVAARYWRIQRLDEFLEIDAATGAQRS